MTATRHSVRVSKRVNGAIGHTLETLLSDEVDSPLPENEWVAKLVDDCSAKYIKKVSIQGEPYPIWFAITDVTPDLARGLMEHFGDKQRKPRNYHTVMLERLAREDKFIFNGAPIVVSSDGQTIDAGHRLRMIIATGKTQTMAMVLGVPPEAYLTYNNAAKGSGSDAVAAAGLKNRVALASAAGHLWRYENDCLLTNMVISPGEIAEIVAQFPSLEHSVNKTFATGKLLHNAGVTAFCHFLFSQYDEAAADEFMERLGSDVGHVEGPILALRRRAVDRKLRTSELIYCFFKAWNAYRTGKKLKTITIRDGDELPVLL